MKNAELWLADCLHSVHRQSYANWECILVDDHSQDNTLSIAQSFVASDDRFCCISNKGTGIVDALNTALSHSQCAWVTRMDADDIMPPEKLEWMKNALGNRKDCVVTGRVRYFSPSPVSEGYRAYETWLNERVDRQDHWEWVYRECVIASANWLTHRDNVQFPTDVYPEDYSLVFDWYRKHLKVIGIDHVTHMWREHLGRTSRTSAHYQQPAFFRMKTARFIELDRDHTRPLVVLGDNVKTELLKEELESIGESPVQIDRTEVKRMDSVVNPQVLVGVYPAPVDRLRLEEWLTAKGLKMGVDWFYT